MNCILYLLQKDEQIIEGKQIVVRGSVKPYKMEDGAKHGECDKDQTLYIPSTKAQWAPNSSYLGRVNHKWENQTTAIDVRTSNGVKDFQLSHFLVLPSP